MYLIRDEIQTLWPLASSSYRSTTRRQFTFYHLVSRSSRYSTDRPWKDERLFLPYSHPVVLNRGPLDWEFSTLTTRSLLHELRTFKKLRDFKRLNICLIKWDFDSFLLWELHKKGHANACFIYSHQAVKPKSFWTLNKTEKTVTINEQNKVEKTNMICLLINTGVQLFFFQESGIWLCCKWKEAYDCPNICCKSYVYNYKVIAC